MEICIFYQAYCMGVSRLAHYIIFIGVAVFLEGCVADKRQNTKIPPLPDNDIRKRIMVGIDFLDDAIRQNPSNAGAYQKRAELYTQLDNWEKALNDANEALDIESSNGSILLTRAKILRHLNEYDQALSDARRAEVLQQNTPELYVLLGDLTQRQRDYKKAKLYLTKALQMAPYESEAYFYTGLVDAKQGDTLTAIVQMKKALELKPNFLLPYIELTSIHAHLQMFDQAKYYNNTGLNYFPKASTLHYMRGEMYQQSRKLDSALIFYRKATLYDSTNYVAEFQAGLIYLKWNNFWTAIKSFQKVARLNPKQPQINFLLATAYDKIGNLAVAVEQYTLASEAEPNDWKIKGLLYRAQQRKNYFDTYGTLPPTTSQNTTQNATTEQTPEKTLDPQDTKLEIITPKLQLKTKVDTARSFKIKQ